MASHAHRNPCSWPFRESMNGAFANCTSMAGSPCIMPPPERRSGRTEANGTPSGARTRACPSASPRPTS
eukprot:5141894-Lingulodinium_polyedra.AAC.1